MFIDDKYNVSLTIFEGSYDLKEDQVTTLEGNVIASFFTNDDVYFMDDLNV